MSTLVILPEKELKIGSDSFQTNRTKIVHRTEEIVIVGFRLKGTSIIVDQISRDKLLQPNKRYALIGNCLEEGKGKSWRPCGVFRLPEELPLQRVEDYIRNTVKAAVRYPRNTYYLRNKDIDKLGLIQMIMENDPETKEIELSIGETALQLCLNKNAEIKLDINDEENRDQIEELFLQLAYLNCIHLEKFLRQLALEIIRQLRENNAQKVIAFFQQHLDKVDWDWLSTNPNISVEFFRQHLNKVNWIYLPENQNISFHFFSKYLHRLDWHVLLENPRIPIEFLQQYLDTIYWYILSANPGIPFSFFQRHSDKVVRWALSKNPSIPVEFWQDPNNFNEIDWEYLSSNPSIPVEFFEQHLENVRWRPLSGNPNIPAEFFERHLENVHWYTLSGNPNIPVDFFERHLENVRWSRLSANPNIPVDFFERHLENVNWRSLSENPNISAEFFEQHLANVDWIGLSENPNVPVEFFEQHLENVNWHFLSGNPGIPVDFWHKSENLSRVDWEYLSANKFLYNTHAMISEIKKSKLFSRIFRWKHNAIEMLEYSLKKGEEIFYWEFPKFE